MKRFSKIMKWVTIVAVVAGVIVAGVYLHKQHHEMDNFYVESYITNELETHENYLTEETALYNSLTRKYTIRHIDWVSDISDDENYAVFSRYNQRGFFDTRTGEIAIKEQYEHAWIFSEGVAAVMKDDKIGFINEKNEVIIPFQFESNEETLYAADILFHNGYCAMGNKDGLFGFIDKSGNWVVEPAYESIAYHKDGYYIVTIGEKYGLLNSQLDTVYPTEYQYITIETDMRCIYIAQDGIMQSVDYDGNIVKPFVSEYINYMEYYPQGSTYDNTSAVLSDYLKYNIGSFYGVIRRDNGKVVIPAVYHDISMVSATMFKANIGNNYYIYFDNNGNIIDAK